MYNSRQPSLYTYLLTHGAEPFLRSRPLCYQTRTSQHFIESESSIPCSQEPSTGPYTEPYQFNPHHPILSPKIHFNTVHPPTSCSPKWSLSFWLSHQYAIFIPLLPHSYYMPRPSHHRYISLLIPLQISLIGYVPNWLQSDISLTFNASDTEVRLWYSWCSQMRTIQHEPRVQSEDRMYEIYDGKICTGAAFHSRLSVIICQVTAWANA
jgi:hypothetical protein